MPSGDNCSDRIDLVVMLLKRLVWYEFVSQFFRKQRKK